MGRGKRKRKTRERHGGGRAEFSPAKPKLEAHPGLGEAEGPRLIEIPDPKIAGETDEGNLTREAQKRITVGVSQEKGDGDLPTTEETHAGDGADEGRDGPSVYLVACHWDWSRSRKPYSVYEMTDAAAPSDDDASSRSPANRKRRMRRLGSLETIAGGKVFTSVRSSRRAWIVGVGGYHGDTVIFDTETKVSIQGPRLKCAKWCPVPAAVGDRVYAMSKIPSWKKDPDFPPWFEVLDLSKSRVIVAAVGGGSYLEDCCWSEVPIPACLPWKLHPIEYTILPFVKLWSCAVVGRYIMVSFNHPWGTHPLDTDSHEWRKVDDERLPFFGCAVRHGCIFLALPKENGTAINAYSIGIAPSGKGDDALKLSVDVLPVKYEEREVDAGPCFCSVDDEHFCSLGVSIDTRSIAFNREYNEWFPRKALVKLKTYETKDTSILETSEEALLAVKQMIVVSNRWEQDLKIFSSSHGCSPFCFALLSM